MAYLLPQSVGQTNWQLGLLFLRHLTVKFQRQSQITTQEVLLGKTLEPQ